MRFHDPMLGCQRKLDEAFLNVKHFMAQQQRLLDDHRQRNQNGGPGPEYGGEEEQWGTDKEQGFSGPDPKKIRRGVSSIPTYVLVVFGRIMTDNSSARCTPRTLP